MEMAGLSILVLMADLKELGLKDLKYGGGGISGQAYLGGSEEVGRLLERLFVLIVFDKLGRRNWCRRKTEAHKHGFNTAQKREIYTLSLHTAYAALFLLNRHK
jgi:hypothetical protein